MRCTVKIMMMFALVVFLAACTTPMQPPLEPLGSGTTSSSGSAYVPKVANFQVLLDASLSMNEAGKNDFLVARDIVSRINQAIPDDLNYNAGLRSFGHDSSQSDSPTDLLYGMTGYSKAGFHDGLSKVKFVGGPSPMAAALEAAGGDLKTASGKSALIVVSDGLFMDDAPAAAEKVAGMLGDGSCIYTIAIGDENNGAGQDLMNEIAKAGKCGFATTDAALADDAELTAFVEKVFLASKPAAKPVAKAVPAKDSDGDGVTDDKDKCPNTPQGEFVDADGCTLKMTLHVNFDFDSAEIKPEFKSDLDRAAAFIKKNTSVPYILIAGHTDDKGEADYNQKLSERRAAAVRNYLIENYNLSAERLGAKGYGKMQPIADNATSEGRYQNRRVEIVCCVVRPK